VRSPKRARNPNSGPDAPVRAEPRRPGRWPGAPASDAGPAHAPRGRRRPADDGPSGSTDEGRCPRRPRSSPPPGGRGEPGVHRDERRPATVLQSRVEVPLFPRLDGVARPSCRREPRHLVDEVQELAHELRLAAAPDLRSVGVASRRAASARAAAAPGKRGRAPVRIASGAYRRPSPARSGTDGGGGDRAMAARSQRGTLGAMPAAPISMSRPPSATGRKSRRSSASLVPGG